MTRHASAAPPVTIRTRTGAPAAAPVSRRTLAAETGPPWAEAIPPWERVTGDDTGIPLPRLGPADLRRRPPVGPAAIAAAGAGLAGARDRVAATPTVAARSTAITATATPGIPMTAATPAYPGHGQAGGYQDAHEDTGYGYPGYAEGGYDRGGGYQEAEYQAGYPDTGTGFPAVGHDYPAGAGFDDTGTGYVHPAYRDDRFTAGRAGYPEGGGYPADDDAYTDHGQATAGRPDRGDDHGYPEAGGWYGDVDDEHEWADDDYEDDDAFLPGLSTDTRRRAGSRPGERGASRGGRRSGKGGGKGGGKGRKSGKRKRGMRRVAPWLALTVLLGLLIGAGGGYFYVYRTYLHPPDYPGSGTGSLVVRSSPGDTASAVGQRLQLAGVVASARAFTNAAKASGHGSALEPGYYRVHQHMKAALAFGAAAQAVVPGADEDHHPRGQTAVADHRDAGPGDRQPARLPAGDQRTSTALGLPSFAKGKPGGLPVPGDLRRSSRTRPPIKMLQAMVTRFNMEAASISLPVGRGSRPAHPGRCDHRGEPGPGRGPASSGLPQDRRGDLQPAERQPADHAAARHHRAVRAEHVRDPGQFRADQGQVAVQHLPAHRPAARPDRQSR